MSTSTAVRQPRLKLKKTTGDQLFSLALIAPTLLVTIVFIIVPVIDSVIKSFTEYKIRNIISGAPGEWNNFENYVKLFEGGKLWPAVIHTLLFVVGVVLAQFVLGMALAVILNSGLKGARFIRSAMMMPWVVPTIISALVWMWIFQPQYGLLKYVVSVFTGGAVTDFAILNDPNTALLAWPSPPCGNRCPDHPAAAERLAERARRYAGSRHHRRRFPAKKFFAIVIPYMKSVISIVVSMAIIENFKQFPLIWTMTGGGPSESTTTLAVLSYREAFVSNNLGSGAAVTTLWMLLMIVVVAVYRKLFQAEDMN